MPPRAARSRKPKAASAQAATEAYTHTDQALLRPDIGLQAQFKKRKPPKTYRYDPSLDPQLSWDINADRERAEALIASVAALAARLPQTTSGVPLRALREKLEGLAAQLAEGAGHPLFLAGQLQEALALLPPAAGSAEPGELPQLKAQLQAAAAQLQRLSSAFLNWAGKAERSAFSVPTLPLFVHERLSTKAILESVRTRKRQLELFSDPQLDLADRALGAYEYKDKWVNRLILGDSLVVMNSLLEFDGLGGQVQMIYIDPPYGVKFGSNFQPFVRKRDVAHNADEDMTREPEMVQAYRDTWEMGLHSYLTYLRDRLSLARELLTTSGSIFVQISDENLHHIRSLMDEVFGVTNFCSVIPFKKTGGQSSSGLPSVADYLVWYAKDKQLAKYNQLFVEKVPGEEGATNFTWIEEADGRRRPLTADEKRKWTPPPGSRYFQPYPMFSEGPSPSDKPFAWNGEVYKPSANSHWKTTSGGLARLAALNRLIAQGKTLRYVNYLSDYPVTPITNIWTDTQISGFAEDRLYVVQTLPKVIQRCILMTTDPGDLVLDPTCGSGTTAYVAEQWGRRWITCDTSRVPLALARQRLLTATFPYYELRDPEAGVHGGFKYERKQNTKGEEVGGIVPHITLKSIAQNEKPEEEVLVDRPNVVSGVVRVSGTFFVEASIPTPLSIDDGAALAAAPVAEPLAAGHYGRMLEALRLSPVLRLPGNKTVQFKSVRAPARALSLHAEAVTAANGEKPVAFVFGPESGAVSERLVFEAGREAYAKSYSHLYVVGFAAQDAAHKLMAGAEGVYGVPTTYVSATMDLAMGDLLKTSRASQVFSVSGQPEVRLIRRRDKDEQGQPLYQVELLGLDVFDPVTMDVAHERGADVPAWFLDTDFDEAGAFVVGQAFFPRTGAWDSLKRALKGTYADDVWEHLAGTVSQPFTAGEQGRIAVKVIDDRGNELFVTKALKDAEPAA
jgi:adenine-specific DNA-methyltransferase